MGSEIERRFLVSGEGWRREVAQSLALRQGFLSTIRERVVRVRLEGGHGTLTIKGVARGLVRSEFEYPIPAADAAFLLDQLCLHPLIEKTRHTVPVAGHSWVVDEFFGVNAGLVMAEIELSHEEQAVALPEWLGREVSYEPRYFNASLAERPYEQWTEAERL